MKQKKKGENCAVFCFTGKRIFFMKCLHGKKEKKALAITTDMDSLSHTHITL